MMFGPDDDFRADVGARAEQIDNEEALERLLADIEDRVASDVSYDNGGDPEDDLAAIQSWASVASHAAARFYAPASPWRRSVAGWSKEAAAQLQRICSTLVSPLRLVAAALSAVSFTIGVSFPWGISISLGW
jgi:hypothetical protein